MTGKNPIDYINTPALLNAIKNLGQSLKYSDKRIQLIESKWNSLFKDGKLTREGGAFLIFLSSTGSDDEPVRTHISKKLNVKKISEDTLTNLGEIENNFKALFFLKPLSRRHDMAFDPNKWPRYMKIKSMFSGIDKNVASILEKEMGNDIDYLDIYTGFASKFEEAVPVIVKNLKDIICREMITHYRIYNEVVIDVCGGSVDKAKLEKALSDVKGFAFAVINKLDEKKVTFLNKLVEKVITLYGFNLSTSQKLNVVQRLLKMSVPLGPNETAPAVKKVIEQSTKTYSLEEWIDKYSKSSVNCGIEESRFTDTIKRRMVQFLINRGIAISQNTGETIDQTLGRYDEHLAAAYHNACSVGAETPSAGMPPGGWDFTVTLFETVTDVAVKKNNILACGLLDYCWEMGERLGIYKLMEYLYESWENGALGDAEAVDDPTQAGQGIQILEELFNSDSTLFEPLEKRMRAYMKALGKGSEVESGSMLVNKDFQQLWANLMEEIADYIGRREEVPETGTLPIGVLSRVPIYEATRQLQYNLSDAGNGATKSKAQKYRELMNRCLTVLDAPEIINAFSYGNTADRWTVIERLHREKSDSVPNISAIRAAAREGNKVFTWIANFNETTVIDEEFEELIRAGEAWIIAKGDDSEDSVKPVNDEEKSMEEDKVFSDFED